jgi:hypothetical protein
MKRTWGLGRFRMPSLSGADENPCGDSFTGRHGENFGMPGAFLASAAGVPRQSSTPYPTRVALDRGETAAVGSVCLKIEFDLEESCLNPLPRACEVRPAPKVYIIPIL